MSNLAVLTLLQVFLSRDTGLMFIPAAGRTQEQGETTVRERSHTLEKAPKHDPINTRHCPHSDRHTPTLPLWSPSFNNPHRPSSVFLLLSLLMQRGGKSAGTMELTHALFPLPERRFPYGNPGCVCLVSVRAPRVTRTAQDNTQPGRTRLQRQKFKTFNWINQIFFLNSQEMIEFNMNEWMLCISVSKEAGPSAHKGSRMYACVRTGVGCGVFPLAHTHLPFMRMLIYVAGSSCFQCKHKSKSTHWWSEWRWAYGSFHAWNQTNVQRQSKIFSLDRRYPSAFSYGAVIFNWTFLICNPQSFFETNALCE